MWATLFSLSHIRFVVLKSSSVQLEREKSGETVSKRDTVKWLITRGRINNRYILIQSPVICYRYTCTNFTACFLALLRYFVPFLETFLKYSLVHSVKCQLLEDALLYMHQVHLGFALPYIKQTQSFKHKSHGVSAHSFIWQLW